MLTSGLIAEHISQYQGRLVALYGDVRMWVQGRHVGTKFSESAVTLAEESTGRYEATSLEFVWPGAGGVRLIPRGIFMVGAQGRVDVRSKLGRQSLVWVRAGGPAMTTAVTDSPAASDEVAISRPLFPDVPQGWAWTDDRRNRLMHLTETVFWDRVLTPLLGTLLVG